MPKSAYDSDIDKATSEFNVSEDWQVIMDITDRIKTAPNGSKDALKSIMKRVNHLIPHVSMQALTLLAACVDNCGKKFLLEVCSREWIKEARVVITRGHVKVSQKLRELIQKWANDFKEDPQLHIMVKFNKQMTDEGYLVEPVVSSVSSTTAGVPKQSKDDELNFKEDLDLAIAMSLQVSEPAKAPSTNDNLYPSFSPEYDTLNDTKQEGERFQVRALYDFEAAEDNEMTFKTDEIFSVLDNSDENWWKGRNERGVGLFPANFVTTELKQEKAIEKKKVRFADPNKASQGNPQNGSVDVTPQQVTINEEHLDLTLSMLKNASPNEIDDEEETIVSMEERSMLMGPLIEKQILASDNKKDDLNDLNDKYLQALSMYQQLMQEPRNVQPTPTAAAQMQPGYPSPQHQYHQQKQFPTQPRYGAVGYNSHVDSNMAAARSQQMIDPAQMAGAYASQPQNSYNQQDQYTTPSSHHAAPGHADPSYQNPQSYSYEYADSSAAYNNGVEQQYPNEQYYGAGVVGGPAQCEYQQDYSAVTPRYGYNTPHHQTSVHQ